MDLVILPSFVGMLLPLQISVALVCKAILLIQVTSRNYVIISMVVIIFFLIHLLLRDSVSMIDNNMRKREEMGYIFIVFS